MLKLSKLSTDTVVPHSKAPLPEWYANVVSLTFPGKSAVIYSHNPSRLTVLTVGKSINTTVDTFRTRLLNLLRRIDAGQQWVVAQKTEMQEIHICKTDSRSMLGSMNEIVFYIQQEAMRAGTIENLDLDKLEDNLGQYLFSGKDIEKQYFKPVDYLRENTFLNLN